ncbi:hypothetical protein LTR62_007772 [Meristemomyces frigidus]|uniref:CBM1 domain-containing protein n=1 Tax=Meristemomyces frigidus TaxID=1508187 RepID=A0AAN7TAC5_9PEZI|nr:hypothetical protein LTR62_007772 [Meristemomyces frigidus]
MSIIQTVALVGSLVATVAAHGHVSGAVIAGTYFPGYDPASAYSTSPPAVIGWTANNLDNGFVAPDAYTGPDIICHKNATVGKASAPIAAGQNVTLQWTTWPSSHHGPVINYLAKVPGDFASVDKTTLEWVKFDASGLLDDSTPPGTWGSDELIANNNSWTLTIPSSLTAGNYVLRHEIIALHSAQSANGAQNYPQCINLAVTGSGTAAPAGTLGEKLYAETDPGIVINLYSPISSYTMPGPALWTAGAAGAAPAPASSAASSVIASSSSKIAPASSTMAAATTSVASTMSTKAVVATSTAAAAPTTAAPTVAASSPCTITMTRSSSAVSSSSASSTAGGSVAKYGQCAGHGTPTLSCVSGTRCVFVNDYYSQCQ